jgi:hypothetical protein
MRALTDRAQLLAEMESARARFLQSIEGLSEEAMSRPEMDGWSVKDQLNHLALCDELRFFEISRISRGGRPASAGMTDEQVDFFNEMVAGLRRALPLAQIMADLEFAHAMVTEAVSSAPEEALDPALYGDGYQVNGSVWHDIEHAEAIDAWRKKEGL